MPIKKKQKTEQEKPAGEFDIHVLGDKLMSHLKEAKKKFNNLDNETKKKIIAGVAGTAALLAGIHKAKKTIKKIKKKKNK